MDDRTRSPLKTVGVVAVVLLLIGFGPTFYSPVPKNAHVVLDHSKKEYHSPRHRFFVGQIEGHPNLTRSTLEKALEVEYEVDFMCSGDFDGEKEVPFQILLRNAGFSANPPLVNIDGSWN